MSEKAFRAVIRKNLKQVHWVTIETWTTYGVADLNACYDGVEFWVELKEVRAGKKVDVRPHQVGWHHQRSRAGGRTWFLVRVVKLDEIWLYPGPWGSALATSGLALPPWRRYARPYRWGDLLGALCTRLTEQPVPAPRTDPTPRKARV